MKTAVNTTFGFLFRTIIVLSTLVVIFEYPVWGQEKHHEIDRDAIDRMRDRDLQPEKILDAINLHSGMIVGEAGASYGYFTFKMSKRIGTKGHVYANDIDSAALQKIESRCVKENIINIKTVLGAVKDPLFPIRDLEMVVVFDCLFEFSHPFEWMQNTKKYLKPGSSLVIVDPDPSKFPNPTHFLSRQQIHEMARKAGYEIIQVNDKFLENHMIIVLQFGH